MAVLTFANGVYWKHKTTPFDSPPKLFEALRAFCRDRSAHGQLPPEVSLQDLVGNGYISSNDVRAFEGFAVTFSTLCSDETPHAALATAVAADGHTICLLADGSVQAIAPQRYEHLHEPNIGLTDSIVPHP